MKNLHSLLFRIGVVISFFVVGCGPKKDSGKMAALDTVYRDSGTIEMAEILTKIKGKADYNKIGRLIINDQGVKYFESLLKNPKGESIYSIKANLAQELLRSGKPENAIPIIEEMLIQMKGKKIQISGLDVENSLKKMLSVCFFRLGEQKNCILNHNAESCIYPIKGQGVYKIQEPTQKAVALFEEILKDDPKDLPTMWLLNIAYMTLGKYPDGVPKKYLIPYDTFDVPYQYGKFVDVAGDIGVDVNELSGSVIMEDFDNDHDLDLFVTSEAFYSQVRYFVNNGDGTFTDRSIQAGLKGITSGRPCVQADFNNDGFLDIFITRGGWQEQEDNYPPNSLLQNNGDGTFKDVTIKAGLLNYDPTYTAIWGDYDNDGWVDIFLSIETKDKKFPHPCKLFRNNGNGTFTNVAAEAGVDVVAFSKGVVFGDYNNDGWADIYMARFDGAHKLFKNNGKGKDGKVTFTDVAKSAGVEKPMQGLPTFFFDFNNDGWLDIFAPNFHYESNSIIPSEYLGKLSDVNAHPNLYLNKKDGTFKDITNEAKLNRIVYAMGANFGDIDNDGYLDFYAGTGFLEPSYLFPNLMFRNNNGKYFEDVSNSTSLGHLQKGHGISFGDIDNDGDQDIYEVLGGGYSGDTYPNALFKNPGSDNHWIKLKLKGVKSNRAAIGAKIKVVLQEQNGEREVHIDVNSGGCFGANPLTKEIGLGKALSIKTIEIFWPATNIKQKFSNLKMNAAYEISEGESAIKEITQKVIQFKANSNKKHHHLHSM